MINLNFSGIPKPVVWGTRGSPDSRSFSHFRGFRDFLESSTQLLVCGCLSCLRRFRHPEFHGVAKLWCPLSSKNKKAGDDSPWGWFRDWRNYSDRTQV